MKLVAPSGRWILLPGTLCTPEVFDPVLDHLGVGPSQRIGFPVDMPSLRDLGHRLSQVVRAGDIVCGFSLGSLVMAQNLAALGRARALVLLSLNPLSDVPAKGVTRRAARDRVQSGDAEGWVTDNWRAMSTSGGPEPRRTVIRMARETTPLIAAQTEIAIARPDATPALLASGLPMVFVTGAEDAMTPPGPVEGIASRAPRATCRVLPGLGHFALLEAPERVAEAISHGLAEVLEEGRR